MRELKKIKVLSLARVLGIIGSVSGLLAAIIIILASRVLDPSSVASLTFAGYISGIFMTIVTWGGAGFIIGLVFAFLYNLLTNYLKGIEFESK